MTNYDRYIDEIMSYIGVDRKTGEVKKCTNDDISCEDCIFSDENCYSRCSDMKKEWLKSEYQPIVDWSKVKIDTPIYVKAELGDEWIPRYFAKYLNGDIYAWNDGKTSFTTAARISWKYAKLAEKGVDNR